MSYRRSIKPQKQLLQFQKHRLHQSHEYLRLDINQQTHLSSLIIYQVVSDLRQEPLSQQK